DAFEAASGQPGTAEATDSAQTLILQQRGAEARGREVGDGFVVLKGSRARSTDGASIHEYLHDLRQQLLDRGVLALDENVLVFT
ncbi:DUF4357 domain-containing protein, partial [Enterococcus hirae]